LQKLIFSSIILDTSSYINTYLNWMELITLAQSNSVGRLITARTRRDLALANQKLMKLLTELCANTPFAPAFAVGLASHKALMAIRLIWALKSDIKECLLNYTHNSITKLDALLSRLTKAEKQHKYATEKWENLKSESKLLIESYNIDNIASTESVRTLGLLINCIGSGLRSFIFIDTDISSVDRESNLWKTYCKNYEIYDDIIDIIKKINDARLVIFKRHVRRIDLECKCADGDSINDMPSLCNCIIYNNGKAYDRTGEILYTRFL
jgi:hypothetical protein